MSSDMAAIKPKCGQILDVDGGVDTECTNPAKYVLENREDWLVCEECLKGLLEEEVITKEDVREI